MYCVILTTTDDKMVAEKLAATLVEKKIAACVQIDETVGVFRWEGKISSGKEFRILIKTRSDYYKKVEELIMREHNYELPQIVKIDLTDGLPEYFGWIDESLD